MDPRLKAEVPKLGGVEEILPQPDGSATRVENFTVDPATGGWDNRIGYEKFFPNGTIYQPFTTEKRIHSLYIWSTHNGARTFHLFESENIASQRCNLRFTVGNPGGIVDVDEFRRIPTLNESVTDYEPFGRYLIIVNGHDKPLKFDGDKEGDNVRPLGWDTIPGSPTPWRTSPNGAGDGNSQSFIFVGPIGPASIPLPDGFAQVLGLGYNDNNAKNSYKWRVSWVSETGSESPLSAPSETVAWDTLTGTTAAFDNKRQAVFLDDIPIGPTGTVARRIYRTKNLGDGASSDAGALYYLVDELKNNTETVYVDYTPDSFLLNLSPSISDSVIFPCPGARFAATFKNCLFLDGGQSDPTRIYYSKPLSPDTFGALDYFDVGVRDGGDVTGLFAYYNSLILFRESSIELVRGDPVNGFSVVPFIQGVGSRAINSVTAVPGVGIMFLGNDGVYRIHGGLDGGSQVKIEKMSPGLVKTEKRLNPALLARASAAYSPKWREWHCYIPVDGEEKPSLGLVYHVDKNAWSTRTGFPVGCIATDPGGELIFGHNTGKPPAPPTPTTWETGLFVISRKRIGGYQIELVIEDQVAVPTPALTSIYKSNWMDMGKAAQKKFIKYVYLHVMTKGDNTIPLKYFKDFDYDGVTSSGEKMQRADHPDQYVFNTAPWATAVWEDPMFTTIRYPIALSAASFFSFEVETNNDFVLIGYSLEFAANKTHTIKGKR
jgi:hypothetical protein